jgi:lipopolysaccharide transport system permease protein
MGVRRGATVMFSYFKELYNYRELLYNITIREIKVRYKHSFLGYFWSIAHPLAFGLTFFFVFKMVMRFPVPDYALFLVSALFPWQAFANSLAASTAVFVANASLIKKVYFPRYCLVISIVLNDTFHLMMSFPVIILFLFFYNYNLADPRIILCVVYLPLNLLAQGLITFGLALSVGAINLFFRDMERLIVIFLNLLFYFTPVIYSVEMVPEKFRVFLYFNPLSLVLNNWRNMWMHFTFDWFSWALSMGIGIAIAGLGSWIYVRLNPRFSEVI